MRRIALHIRPTVAGLAVAAAALPAALAPAPAGARPLRPPTHLRLHVQPLGIDILYRFSWNSPDADVHAVQIAVDGGPFSTASDAAAGSPAGALAPHYPAVPGGVILQDSDEHLSDAGHHRFRVRFVAADGSASPAAGYGWSNSTAAQRHLRVHVHRVQRGMYRLKVDARHLRRGQRITSYRWQVSGQTVCRRRSCRVHVATGRYSKLKLTVIDSRHEVLVRRGVIHAR